MTENVFMNLAFGILVGLGVCCLVASFSQAVRVMLSSLFAVAYRPISQIRERTLYYVQAIKPWILRQVENESERKEDGPLYSIIGSILYSVLTGLFMLCDFGMIVLTVQAMGMDEPTFHLPVDTS